MYKNKIFNIIIIKKIKKIYKKIYKQKINIYKNSNLEKYNFNISD